MIGKAPHYTQESSRIEAIRKRVLWETDQSVRAGPEARRKPDRLAHHRVQAMDSP